MGLTILYGIDRLCRRLLGEGCIYPYAFYSQPITRNSRMEKRFAEALPDDLQFEVLTGDSPGLAAFGIDEEARRHRFSQDAVCLCLSGKHGIEAMLWYAPGPFNEDEVFCRYVRQPSTTTVWDFGVEVIQEKRNTPHFARLWALANRRLRERGITHTLSRISRFNSQSIHSHERLGAHYIGKATFFRAGRMQMMFSSLAPYFHVTVTGRPPTLTFAAGSSGQK